ncbi:hypothetical protein D3C78_1666100 [compost metagenome]
MDMHQPMLIDAGDIAGVQPAVLPEFFAAVGVFVIRRCEPRAAHQQLTDLVAVLGQRLMVLVDQFHLNQWRNHPRAAAPMQLLFFIRLGKVCR